MSALPGNPFAEVAEIAHREHATSVEADATLALVFEQRTANLIAFYGDGGQGDAYDALHDQIVSRLGMTEES